MARRLTTPPQQLRNGEARRPAQAIAKRRAPARTPGTRVTRKKTAARAPRQPARSEDLVRLYLRDIGRIPMLTDDEFAAMAVRIDTLREQGDPDPLQVAYQDLAAANLRLVVSIAKRYTNCGISLMDLIQAGNMGLMKAVEGFDFSRGCRLSTYASKWIHASITRYISNQARTIRVPVNVIPMMSRLDRAAREHKLRYGHQPTIPELASAAGLTAIQVRDLLGVPQRSISLDFPIRGDESNVTLSEVVEDPNAEDSRAVVEKDLFFGHLATAFIDALDERERKVLRLRYGLDGGDVRTQSEIGELLKVSRQRISQIESRALRRLRSYDTEGLLESYVN